MEAAMRFALENGNKTSFFVSHAGIDKICDILLRLNYPPRSPVLHEETDSKESLFRMGGGFYRSGMGFLQRPS